MKRTGFSCRWCTDLGQSRGVEMMVPSVVIIILWGIVITKGDQRIISR